MEHGTNIDWVAFATQTLNQLMTPIALSIGIALSVWVIVLGVSAIRRFGKF